DETAEQFLLALRRVDFEAVALLDDADLVNDVGALVEEADDVAVDRVDLSAQVFEAHGVSGSGAGGADSSGVEDASGRGASAGAGASVDGVSAAGRGTRRSSEAFGRSSSDLMPKCSMKSSVVS